MPAVGRQAQISNRRTVPERQSPLVPYPGHLPSILPTRFAGNYTHLAHNGIVWIFLSRESPKHAFIGYSCSPIPAAC